jgi:hypothetical protein
MAGMTANDLNTDKGEVGGSSPPRPPFHFDPIPQKSYRMPHHHNYAAILTFCVSRILSPKTLLPTIGLFPFGSIHGCNSHEEGAAKCAV